MSVDMISENERFYNSEDLKMYYRLNYSLEDWVRDFSKVLGKQKIIKKHPEMKQKIILLLHSLLGYMYMLIIYY